MIDYEILQDIITDHELCKTQENELAKVVELLKADRLIELPCKVGTPIYYVTSYIDIKTYDFKYHIVKAGFKVAYLANFGKTVFLTKEEAEARLAELKGGKADGN